MLFFKIKVSVIDGGGVFVNACLMHIFQLRGTVLLGSGSRLLEGYDKVILFLLFYSL